MALNHDSSTQQFWNLFLFLGNRDLGIMLNWSELKLNWASSCMSRNATSDSSGDAQLFGRTDACFCSKITKQKQKTIFQTIQVT